MNNIDHYLNEGDKGVKFFVVWGIDNNDKVSAVKVTASNKKKKVKEFEDKFDNGEFKEFGSMSNDEYKKQKFWVNGDAQGPDLK